MFYFVILYTKLNKVKIKQRQQHLFPIWYALSSDSETA